MISTHMATGMIQSIVFLRFLYQRPEPAMSSRAVTCHPERSEGSAPSETRGSLDTPLLRACRILPLRASGLRLTPLRMTWCARMPCALWMTC